MTCKDCIHKKACDSWHGMGDAQYNEWSSMENIETICVNFQNKADVQEVKHGEWVEMERAHYFKCSECRNPIPYKFGWKLYNGVIANNKYYNYCPHCGARMDRSDEQ